MGACLPRVPLARRLARFTGGYIPAPLQGESGTTPELAAATKQHKQAALDRYGVGEAFYTNVDNSLGAISHAMSPVATGLISGGFGGSGSEAALKATSTLDSQVGLLEEMAQQDSDAAAQVASDILNRQDFPLPGDDGTYESTWGILPGSNRNRKSAAGRLTSIRNRLQRLSGS